jgi:predicted component of type VI protein secretion system
MAFQNRFVNRQHSPNDDLAGARALRSATTPEQVGAALLDPSGDALGAQDTLGRLLRDAVIHHSALLQGVLRGVRALIEEISPRRIETELEQQAQQGKVGFMMGPYRFKRLWEHWSAAHHDLDDGDEGVWRRVFGDTFARTYLAERTSKGKQPTK